MVDDTVRFASKIWVFIADLRRSRLISLLCLPWRRLSSGGLGPMTSHSEMKTRRRLRPFGRSSIRNPSTIERTVEGCRQARSKGLPWKPTARFSSRTARSESSLKPTSRRRAAPDPAVQRSGRSEIDGASLSLPEFAYAVPRSTVRPIADP